MYGDPDRLRADAAILRQASEELRAAAARLLTTSVSTRWQSCAGDGMRRRLQQDAADLRRCAVDFAQAADALLHHATAVAAAQARIRAIEATARSVVHGLLEGISSAVGAVSQALGGTGAELAHRLRVAVSGFPPSGSVAWLDVPDQLRRLGLPGLSGA